MPKQTHEHCIITGPGWVFTPVELDQMSKDGWELVTVTVEIPHYCASYWKRKVIVAATPEDGGA